MYNFFIFIHFRNTRINSNHLYKRSFFFKNKTIKKKKKRMSDGYNNEFLQNVQVHKLTYPETERYNQYQNPQYHQHQYQQQHQHQQCPPQQYQHQQYQPQQYQPYIHEVIQPQTNQQNSIVLQPQMVYQQEMVGMQPGTVPAVPQGEPKLPIPISIYQSMPSNQLVSPVTIQPIPTIQTNPGQTTTFSPIPVAPPVAPPVPQQQLYKDMNKSNGHVVQMRRNYYVTVAYPYAEPFTVIPSIYNKVSNHGTFTTLFEAHITLTAEYVLHAKAQTEGGIKGKLNTIFSSDLGDAKNKLMLNAERFVGFLAQKHPNQPTTIKNDFIKLFFVDHTLQLAGFVNNVLVKGEDQTKNVKYLKTLYINNLKDLVNFFSRLGYNPDEISYHLKQHLYCTLGEPIDKSQNTFINSNTENDASIGWGREGYIHEIIFDQYFAEYETFFLNNMSFRTCLNDGAAFGKYLDSH